MAKKKEDFGVIAEEPRVRMGSDLLDLLVGGDKGVYGLPFGVIIQIWGDSSAGKAAPLDTNVLTPTGWKQMGDIHVGDTVVTPYRGQYAKVLGVYPQGKRDVYRFYFDDNSTVESADNHYWVVQSPNQYNAHKKTSFGAGRGFCLVSTKELADLYKDGTPAPASVAVLPTIDPIEFAPRKAPKIPAYLMGLLISDGSLTIGTPKVTIVEDDVLDKASKYAATVGLELRKTLESITYTLVPTKSSKGRSWVPAYIRSLQLNCKSVDKHIPEDYLYGTINDRVALLHGLFDGDGYMSKWGCASYSTSSYRLAKDVAELTRGLGLKTTISKPKRTSYVGKDGVRVTCHDSYTIHLVPSQEILPFSSRKHTERFRKTLDGTNAYCRTRRRLHKVEYVGKKPCQCIYIDHPMHLYIMDNYVPTHNTFIKNEMIASTYWQMGGPKANFVWESDDSETGDTFKTEYLYGVNLHPETRRIGPYAFHDSETVEEMDGKLTNMLNWMPEGTYGIYAVDSLDGLASKTIKKKEANRAAKQAKGEEVSDEGDFGAQIAKFLSQDFFRTKHKTLEKKKTTLIIVSQTRTNIGAAAFAPKKKTSNGDAMEFYCHTRVKVSRLAWIEREGTKVGVVVKATTTKSKTPRPYREVIYTAYFDYGIDNIGSNIDYLFDLRGDSGELSLKKASAIAWSANAKKKTMANLKDWLDKNGWTAACKADRKTAEGSNSLTVDWVIGWATEDPERKANFDEEFGEEYTRDELIKLCEDNPKMAEELTQRVREKWEEHEDAVATKRPSKYGTRPMEQPTTETSEAE